MLLLSMILLLKFYISTFFVQKLHLFPPAPLFFKNMYGVRVFWRIPKSTAQKVLFNAFCCYGKIAGNWVRNTSLLL